MPIKSVFASHPCQQPLVPASFTSVSDPCFQPSLPHSQIFSPSLVLPPLRPNTNPRCNLLQPSSPSSTPVQSSLVLRAWRFFLHDYPDKDFVSLLLHIIEFGANIGFIGQQKVQFCENLKSISGNEQFVSEAVQKLVIDGHTVGPYSTLPLADFRCSPLGVVSRTRNPSKLRIINHLSWPQGSSVNDGIPDTEASISYDMFECAIDDLLVSGRGSRMAKLDLKDAFRYIPIRAQDWNLLGFDWGCKFYFMLVLAFGLKTTPYIFNLFAEALHWIIERHIPAALRHYLDNFILIFRPDWDLSVCNAAVEWVIALGQELGLCFQDSKTVWPCTTLEFLGLEIDSLAMEAHLPPDKLCFLRNMLVDWSARKKCTLLELQKLTGYLQFCSQVIPHSRSYLRGLFDFSSSFSTPRSSRHIPASAHADIRWWAVFSQLWNGVRLITPRKYSGIPVFTDASGRKGLGGVFGTQWFSSCCPRCHRDRDIQFKEVYAVLRAVLCWGDQWSGQHVSFFCDNQAVVVWLNSGTAKSVQAMNVIRTISMLAACLNFTYDSVWIPTEKNLLADAASCFQLNLLLSLAPHLDRKSSSTKSRITGMKHTLTSRDWPHSFSGMASPPVHASLTVPVNGPSSALLSFTLSCSMHQGSPCQHQPGCCLNGSHPLATEAFNPKQLSPTSPPFVPSMSTTVCHSMPASQRPSIVSLGASSISMVKKTAALSSPSFSVPFSN